MTVELTLDEARIVIAVLTYAEDAARTDNYQSIVNAMDVLRPWRSALLESYVRMRIAEDK